MFIPRSKLYTRRKQLLQSCRHALLLGGLVRHVSYRLGLHGRLGVSTHHVSLPPRQRLARPLKIAFASDLHAGPSTHPAIFEQLFARLQQEQPDLLLLGGDYVAGPAHHAAQLCAGLAACQPPLGKFGVFGNHDLATDDGHIGAMFAAAGVQMLVNRAVGLAAPFQQVSVCGMDDPWTGEPNPRMTFARAGAVRIFLVHAPDGLLTLSGQRYHIAFAGHTHGGQIARRNGRPLVWPKGPLSRKLYHGRYAVAGNGDLIVTRGVGCSTIPVRLNADPELVICTLQ
ncbi:metallophosphoesterase [Pseudoduganella sp. FT93W]|uniref:Metallophosphoesterase n=1 Tax=Duganella fentianensis TaxID=2692177 RepID=A0A845HTT9_9BURK|nr:metallophosphoesterase [Duganella fentianensis]MYN44399.1 metallophosphoesterase [Duganella fentianensis]